MMYTILIIEDNDNVRENLEELLQLSAYHTLSAPNGREGVSLAIQHKPDLILCDIMMPVMDGFGVLKVLSNHASTMDVPFIFLTAKSEKEDFRKGMGLGADDYIVKPYDDVQLLETIERRIAKSQRIKQSFDGSGTGLQRFIDYAKAEKEFEKLSENREVRSYKKRDIVYEINHYPKWLFFVQSGSVKTYQVNDFSKEFTTNIYKEGQFFGYLPLLTGMTYVDNAAVMEDTQLRLIPAEDFKVLLFNHREFAAKFIKMLANQSEENEKLLIELAYSSVRKRVANALLKFCEVKDTHQLSILRDDIASLAGTAKETTIRTLSDFKSEGIIAIEDNIISILKKDRLIQMPQ